MWTTGAAWSPWRRSIDKLWEDRLFDEEEKTKNSTTKAVMIATHTFEEAGAPGISRRGVACAISERDKVYCDYYKLLEAKSPKSPHFTGRIPV